MDQLLKFITGCSMQGQLCGKIHKRDTCRNIIGNMKTVTGRQKLICITGEWTHTSVSNVLKLFLQFSSYRNIMVILNSSALNNKVCFPSMNRFFCSYFWTFIQDLEQLKPLIDQMDHLDLRSKILSWMAFTQELSRNFWPRSVNYMTKSYCSTGLADSQCNSLLKKRLRKWSLASISSKESI